MSFFLQKYSKRTVYHATQRLYPAARLCKNPLTIREQP